ncbi:MAG TPA: NUDIX hydrolase [Chitinophagales bacterium]|nr:NUDIX hydrolase [Chitinophagales bacterium]HRG27951.1 NUDIX hydrolase [Chitinophagales bacterium]HRG85417.1 NUDIX hydrolase [Chitinophagales bacterium]HRH51715.1 NUDIX hydrolase [Chitinophagales bacterium]
MFNVRVYGLLIHNNQILIVKEPIKNNQVIKFPGGGLEFGEGTIDGLKREFKEELGVTITDVTHFYTTDFFVPSFLNPEHQVISIYYLVKANPDELNFNNAEGLTFSWIPLSTLSPSLFPLPIDKHVVQLLTTSQAY